MEHPDPPTDTLALYRTMTTPQLRQFRTAFSLDLAHAGHDDGIRFCLDRLAIIDDILRERSDPPVKGAAEHG
jgi:hypothetical protein